MNAPAAALQTREAAERSDGGPPSLPFVLSVGVTGHRAESLPQGSVERLREQIRAVLLLVADAGQSLLQKEQDCFARLPMRLRFISPIADGADQIAAEVALELGWELQVALPFGRAEYRASLANQGARERFDSLMERASCVLELPGHSQTQVDAYVMTGRATVAHCDLLIAVWDGLPPRGRGGTGEVVQLAITRGTAVIHLPLEQAAPPRVVWSAFDPAVVTLADEPGAERPLDRTAMDAMLQGLLMPPPITRSSSSSSASRASGCGPFARGLNTRCCWPLWGSAVLAQRTSRTSIVRRRSATNGAAIVKAAPTPFKSRRR